MFLPSQPSLTAQLVAPQTGGVCTLSNETLDVDWKWKLFIGMVSLASIGGLVLVFTGGVEISGPDSRRMLRGI